MRLASSRILLSSILMATAVACSKPAAPTPELTEPAPAPVAAATAAPADVSTPPAATSGNSSADVSLSTVYFDFDSYVLNGSAQDSLRKVATQLKGAAGVKLQIEGHCDDRGSNEYNLALGERRARAIQEFLVSEGVSSAELSTISYGEERTAAQGTGEDVWAKNRRGEFRKL